MTQSKKTYLFYEGGLLKTGLSGLSYRGIFRHQTQLLAELSITDKAQILLPLVDQKNSVEGAHIDSTTRAFAYTPFGHNPETPKDTLLAFNGEPCERFSQLYLLGQGYRAFNTRVMRFHSPDSLSPFAPYCMNSYAYCLGDPINFSDPSGHMPKAIKSRASKYGKNSTNLTHPSGPKSPTSPASPSSPLNLTMPKPPSSPQNLTTPKPPSGPLDLTVPRRPATTIDETNLREVLYKLADKEFVHPRDPNKFATLKGARLFSDRDEYSDPTLRVKQKRPVVSSDPLKYGLIEGRSDRTPEPLSEVQGSAFFNVLIAMSESVLRTRKS
ncbi:RHS repeat-associated core domain-containing protein [Pseudomonas sp. MLB6B]